MANTKTLDISPVGRVEGDLDVRVTIEDGVVTDAWTSAELFRGFEVILRGKDPQAGLIVTPRTCGICGASHLNCAAWALDTAWQTEVPRNAILARNLGQITETLQSIPRHHYALFSIDFTNEKYKSSPFYAEACARWTAYTGRHYEIGITASSKPVEVYAIFGGQWPHSSFMVPGGVMCAPTLTDITRARAVLEYYRSTWLEPVLLGCSIERYCAVRSYEDFLAWLDESPAHADSDLGLYWRMGCDIGLDTFGGGAHRFLSWGYLPHEDKYQHPTVADRAAALLMKSGIYDMDSDSHLAVDEAGVRECTARAWYDEGLDPVHPYDRETTPIAKTGRDFDGNYSWSTAVSHHEYGRLEAGPLARQLIAGGSHGEFWQHQDPLVLDMMKNMGGPNLLLRHFARLHETVKLYLQALRCLEQFVLDDPWYIKPRETDGRGWGATEAVRGALAHWVDIRNGKIHNYQIVAPTTWNIGPRDGAGQRGPVEEALIGAPIADPSDPVEVGHVARSFDSCLVCTVHAYDGKSGKQLATFRVS